MKHLYFVRHGLSVMNKQGLRSGHTDTPLAPEGREQARAAGAGAKDLQIDCIVSSPLQRAQETARIIAEQICYPVNKVMVNQLLIERNFGSGEGQPYNPQAKFEEMLGCETVDELLARSRQALDFLEQLPYQNILVVGHGSSGRALRSLVLKDFPFTQPHQLENATVIQWL